jgi:hypothetical protein
MEPNLDNDDNKDKTFFDKGHGGKKTFNTPSQDSARHWGTI